MNCYSKSGSASGLVQVFFGCLMPTDSGHGESDHEDRASLIQAVPSGERLGG